MIRDFREFVQCAHIDFRPKLHYSRSTMSHIVARSISRPVRERLHRSCQDRFDARVLAVFERACELVTHDGDVVALVSPQIGDGPLNVVVDGAVGLFARVHTSTPVRLELEEERLWVGGLAIDLKGATGWEPRPDWATLRERRAAIASCLPLLHATCLRHAPAGSLLPLLGAPPHGNGLAGGTFAAAREAAQALREGWAGDLERLQAGAAGLAGLGGGLTPAGDDFLTGAMLWAWLAHPTPARLCRALAEAAVHRTTTLSAAFLRAAARGECSAPWHALLAALSEGLGAEGEARITAAVQEILARGATSGADSLAGFLSRPASARWGW
jgi:hypothetical protein